MRLSIATCAAIVLLAALPDASRADEPHGSSASAKWTEFYRDAAKQYSVTRLGTDQTVRFNGQAVFDWASIDDFNGAVFAWTENGRPTVLTTIFSFPVSGSKQRTVVHESVSFADVEVVVAGPEGTEWKPPPLKTMQPVPDAWPPPTSSNLLKLQCRRLAKDFSAYMNRRGERWDLRLLPTPLLEYQRSGSDVLGGGLFAFVGYSTDPEILLLLEARTSGDGPAWYYHAVRFSDKSLYLAFNDKPVWESLRAGHGTENTDTDDPFYRVLLSTRLAPEIVEKLSGASAKE